MGDAPKLPFRKPLLLLAVLRLMAGATQAEVAAVVHCSKATIRKIEGGEKPGVDLSVRLESLFRRPIQQLLTPVIAGELS